MTQPKYKIGDKAWLMFANQPTQMKLFNIVVQKKDIWYGLKGDFGDGFLSIGSNLDNRWTLVHENCLFPTKKYLINSL